MTEPTDIKDELLAREEERAAQRQALREADPTIGLNLEGQRRSTNVVEYQPNLWDQITSFFRGPQKDLTPAGFWSYDLMDVPNGFSDEEIFNLRKLTGFLTDEALESESPEVRNLHRLRSNEEAFEGYLYDLDSRGIRVVTDLDNGNLSFHLRLSPYDSFGNPIATEQLRQTEELLRQREPDVYARSEERIYAPINPLPGPGNTVR